MSYLEYAHIEWRRLEGKFTDATLDRHETRILKALYACRPRLTPIKMEVA